MDTVELVRGLEGAGSTLCILDNHECNAMAWNTEDPAHLGEFLRPHGRPGNQEQHKLFLDEVEGTPKHAEMLARLRTLALWLDLGAVRFRSCVLARGVHGGVALTAGTQQYADG